MTREEAIEIMQINRDGVANMSRSEDRTKTLAALDMAIKALEQEHCEDAISRQAALEKIHWLGLDNDTAIKCDLAIRALSSVNTQEAKTSNSENPSEDAISRQAVLDVIAETDITNGTEPVFTGKQVQALLRDLPLVTPKQIGWIPVSERLPSSGKTEDYLACCSDGYISTIMYDADNGRWLIDGAEVVAWMPLPEPYKAESEE